MDAMIRPAQPHDLAFLAEHDRHISLRCLDEAISQGRILMAEADGRQVGWLRWNLFWDNTPFMNLLYLIDGYRMQGLDRALLSHWERQQQESGHALVMTSTQADEAAQHFYRHLGYRDVGGFLLPGETFELLMAKEIGGA